MVGLGRYATGRERKKEKRRGEEGNIGKERKLEGENESEIWRIGKTYGVDRKEERKERKGKKSLGEGGSRKYFETEGMR